MSDNDLWKSFEYPEQIFHDALKNPSLKDICYGLYWLVRAHKGTVGRGGDGSLESDDWKSYLHPESYLQSSLDRPTLSDICYGLYWLTRAHKMTVGRTGRARAAAPR